MYFGIFIVIPLFLIAKDNKHQLTGIWYNGYIQQKIEIVSVQDGLKVKGIHSSNGWIYFAKIGRLTYSDVHGNKLKSITESQIIFSSNHRKARLTFIPLEMYRNQKEFRSKGRRNGDEFDDYDDRNQRWYSTNQDYIDKNDSYNPTKNGKVIQGIQDLEGKWSVKDISKIVLIVETRDGLKARFNDEHQWFVYKKEPFSNHIFKSDEGHQYLYTDDGKLVWTDKTNTKYFYLTKISDDF